MPKIKITGKILLSLCGLSLASLTVFGIIAVKEIEDLGTYALKISFFDTGVMFCFGLLGYFMKKHGFPIVPMLLAIILGPNLEEHLRISLIISQGDPTIFITHPISLIFIIISIFSFISPFITPAMKTKLKNICKIGIGN